MVWPTQLVRRKVFISYHQADADEIRRLVAAFDHAADSFIARGIGAGMTGDIVGSTDGDYVMSRIQARVSASSLCHLGHDWELYLVAAVRQLRAAGFSEERHYRYAKRGLGDNALRLLGQRLSQQTQQEPSGAQTAGCSRRLLHPRVQHAHVGRATGIGSRRRLSRSIHAGASYCQSLCPHGLQREQ